MVTEEIFKIAAAIIFSFGSAGAIIFSLATWLGKVWANRIFEQDRAKYAGEIEKIKVDFQKELEGYKGQLEISKLLLNRYSENQFPLYNEIWIALYELRISADSLWREVNKENLRDLVNKLLASEIEIERKSLLIEEEHYRKLKVLIDKFWNFTIGKTRLIQMRRDHQMNTDLDMLGELTLTRENKIVKEEYDELVEEIRKTFKQQLKGDVQR